MSQRMIHLPDIDKVKEIFSAVKEIENKNPYPKKFRMKHVQTVNSSIR
jgi:hypothetical protein